MSDMNHLSVYAVDRLDHMLKVAATMFKSSLLPGHIRSPEAALFMMEQGISLGMNPITFMTNSAMIQGKIFMGINVCQALLADKGIKWQIIENTAKTCKIKFIREGWPEHTEVYDEEDFNAQKLSGKDSWKTNPKQITRAQAFRRGARIVAPDILLGMDPVDESEVNDWKREPTTVIEHQTDFAKTADAGVKARAIGSRAKPIPELPPQPTHEPIMVSSQSELVQESIPAGGSIPPGIMESGQVSPEPAPKAIANGTPNAKSPGSRAIAETPKPGATIEAVSAGSVPGVSFDGSNTEHRKAITRMMDDRVIPGRWRNANRDALLTHLEGRSLKDCPGILDEYIQGNPIEPVALKTDLGGK